MSTEIRITIKDIIIAAELFDTVTARSVAAALPLEAEPNEWGDEFYFEIPVRMPLDETATKKVSVGDIGYWPPGNALAIFFGPTPMSKNQEPVPASQVNIVGIITGDATILRQAKGARVIRLERC